MSSSTVRSNGATPPTSRTATLETAAFNDIFFSLDEKFSCGTVDSAIGPVGKIVSPEIECLQAMPPACRLQKILIASDAAQDKIDDDDVIFRVKPRLQR